MTKHIEPSIKESAFNCPHCGALAAQRWYCLYSDSIPGDSKTPRIPSTEILEEIAKDRNFDESGRQELIRYFERVTRGEIFHEHENQGSFLHDRIVNLHASECFNCHGFSVWAHNRVIYPTSIRVGVDPNEDLDEDIKRDFEEARRIVDLSPRGAAALLRLALQKLCKQLGESGSNIDADIASLVAKGLNPLIQKTLDIVRVIGNEAVHPGSLDLRDDRETAHKLFSLINSIAQQMISHPKEVEVLYGKIPETKRAGIDARNAKAMDKAKND